MDREHFRSWYTEDMRVWYEVVAEGVSKERAVSLCSTSEATFAVVRAKIREINAILNWI